MSAPDLPNAAPPPRPAPAPATPALAIDALRQRWPGARHDTLDIAALRLEAGRTLFLRGPSGCGKSTLLGVAAGVLPARAGRVQLMGRDWAAMPARQRDRWRADQLGYIFQQFNLLPYLTVLDNVRLPLRFSAVRAQRAAARPACDAPALLAATGLAEALWRQPARALSVGQQQRVAAARALVGAPPVVIADEPTSALDESAREAFMALLLGQCADVGSALLFVSHDARLAGRFDGVLDLPTLNRAGTAAAGDAP